MHENGNVSPSNNPRTAPPGLESNDLEPINPKGDATASERREFKLSSKHLTLASAYFKKALNGPWREATDIHEDGLRHLRTGGFNFDAMEIILNVIHGKDSLVPRELDLQKLAEVARIVDYIQCYEVIGLYSTSWIVRLQNQIPPAYDAQLLLWIFIAGAFRNEATFRFCTCLAILVALSKIPTTGLSILPEITDEIDRLRVHHLDSLFAAVDDFIDRLITQNTCTISCDAVRLGILYKYLHANLLIPRPKSPYNKLSVSWVIKLLKSLPPCSKSLYMESGVLVVPPATTSRGIAASNSKNWRARGFHCAFKDMIQTVTTLESEIKGLSLDNTTRPC